MQKAPVHFSLETALAHVGCAQYLRVLTGLCNTTSTKTPPKGTRQMPKTSLHAMIQRTLTMGSLWVDFRSEKIQPKVFQASKETVIPVIT